MSRTITYVTTTSISRDMLMQFLLITNVKHEYVMKEEAVYLDSESASIMVDLDISASPDYHDPKNWKILSDCIGGRPQSEVIINIYSPPNSTQLAFDIAAKMIEIWGGCVAEDVLPEDEEATKFLSAIEADLPETIF